MMMTVMMMTTMTLVCFFRKVFFAVPLKSFYSFNREVVGEAQVVEGLKLYFYGLSCSINAFAYLIAGIDCAVLGHPR